MNCQSQLLPDPRVEPTRSACVSRACRQEAIVDDNAFLRRRQVAMDVMTRRDFLKTMHAMLCYAALCYAKPLVRALCEPAVIWHGKRDVPLIALTFDDCYNLIALHELEDILDDNIEARVTFFPTGLALRNTSSKDAELWQRLLAKGHEIAYHGYSHDLPSTMSTNEMIADFEGWYGLCSQVLDRTPEVRFARPPYGDMSSSFMNLCCERSLVPVMWSSNWGGIHRRRYREVEQVQNGDIVLLHIRQQDVENARAALPIIKEKRLRVVTLSELLSDSLERRNHEQEDDEGQLCGPERACKVYRVK